MERLQEKIFSRKLETKNNLSGNWNQLKCVTTDGGRNMCGIGKGHIHKACETVRCSKPMVIHSVIHQQVLCGKYLNLSCFGTNFVGELHSLSQTEQSSVARFFVTNEICKISKQVSIKDQHLQSILMSTNY